MASSQQYLSTLFSLANRTALVTGGTRGIGAGLAIALASAGADIILLTRSPSSCHNTSTKIESLGRKCNTITCDLSDKSSVATAIPRVLEQHGKVDILVNCAGWHRRKPAVEYTDEEVEGIWRVNAMGGFVLSRDLARVWLEERKKANGEERKNNKIVNVASVLSFVGGKNLAAYVSTKGAIAQVTKAFANEWAAEGVNVNAIAPGYIRTDLTKDLQEDKNYNEDVLRRTPVGRWGVPEDLAGMVVFLASSASDFVSGAVIPVDGGFIGR